MIDAHDARDYFAVIVRAVFQAGVSWAQIARHWHVYARAFADFDPAIVARFDDLDVERILAEPGVLRMPRKVHAVIANARAFVEIERAFGDFAGYVGSFADYAPLAKDLKKRFTQLGDMSVWYLLFRTGHTVPRFEQWVRTIPGDHPRMREMVERARAMGRSAEAAEAAE